MNFIRTALVIGAAFLAAFWESAFAGLRHLVGVQMDLLPALMVYASLQASFSTVCLLALAGGLFFDSLSANPLGITTLPLLVVGLAFYAKRDLIMRNQLFAQAVLGLAASATVPFLTLVCLLSTGQRPLFGWSTIWELTFMALSGAVATPLVFILFEWLERTFSYTRRADTSFRPDRELRRGR